MKKLLIPIGALLLSGFAEAQLSTTENYVHTKTYLDYNGTTATKTSETVQYFDGLGRPKQVVNVKASPLGRDVVTPIEYDGFGRQVKDYLPIPQGNTLNGAIVPNPLGNAVSAYGGEKIFSEKTLEDSPLDRLLEQRAVGNDWNNKPVKLSYEANTAGEVKKYVATFNYTTFTSSITLSGSYGAAQLYKNTVTDEDGNKTIEFKNGQGQTLLVRKINGTENVDTYYVYNDYNQLAYVISPLAAVSGATDEATLNNLCYQYKYDGRNRLVEKKLPGKGWEYMVYDKQDRLVLTQDANLREKNQWLFTKYDQFSRPVYTGISYSASGRIQHVAAVESFGSANESRTSASWNSNGIDVYYTKSGAYPNQSNFTILTVNYYDAYFTGDPFPSKVWNQDVLPSSPQQYDRSTKGLPVIKLVKNIEDDGWTKTYFYYDLKGRPIREYIFNHLGGYTNVERQLDFSGAVQQTVTSHKRLNTDADKVITENFTYDHQNRLLVHKHKVDSQPEEILAQNKYNEISQLENKKVGGTNAASPLQSIDYAYNIRGWMTAINPNQMTVPDLGGKLFSYKIKYNHKEGISYPNPVFAALEVKPKYNGNITEVDWRSVGNIGNNPSITPKRYGYVYDGLNRLMAGYYQNPDNAYSGENIESLLYDLNGNITSLYRTSVVENTNSITPTTIDNLAYSYIGNRVNTITDSSNNPTGYEGGGQTITYDLNGNMKSMPDKQITAISYNYLNLPNSIVLQGFRSNTHHLYNANGIKLHKRIMETNDGINGSVFTTVDTDYLDGFQYVHKEESGSGSPGDGGTPIGGEPIEALSSPLRRAMEVQAFSPEAKNILSPSSSPGLQFFPTAEGFYDYQKKQYIYQYKDHLGNVRVSFGKNTRSQALEITDVNDYYPFGMNHLKTGTAMFGQSSYKNYKYNGKELQETGMYDFGARQYMSEIGRWVSPDPLTEEFSDWTPYNYVFSNPLTFTDPNGMSPLGDYYNKLGQYLGSDNKNDNKVYVADSKTVTKNKDGSSSTTFNNAVDLGITHSQFKMIAGVVKQEGLSNDPNEYNYIAHANKNEADGRGKSMFSLLMSGYSSVPSKKELSETNSSSLANFSRAGVIDALTNTYDPTDGARLWDGTDFLAWGLSSPNGTPQNKFEEYKSISISGSLYNKFLSANQSKFGDKVKYYGKYYNLPQSVFTNKQNWANGNFIFNTGVKTTYGIQATAVAGNSIFWKKVK